jgi:hypothetical protein
MASNAKYFGNVQFVAVARIASTGIVIASHSYNTKTDLNGVRQVLEQPNMNMAPGKHYTFNVNELAWHLIAGLLKCLSYCYENILLLDDIGLIYILICKSTYPQRCAHTCLEELQRTVILIILCFSY